MAWLALAVLGWGGVQMSAAVEEILPLPPGLGDPSGQMRERVAELRRLRDGVRRGPGGRAGEAQKARGS